jgi:hypothetical protein
MILASFTVIATVPQDWALESSKPLPIHDVSAHYEPLVEELGSRPTLLVTDDGMAPTATGPIFGRTIPPRVLRARVEVGTTNGRVSPGTAVHVARSLATALRPCDHVSMKKDGAACFGLSVLRAGELAVACGSVGGLDLGEHVRVRSAWEELQEAQAVFRRVDDQFQFNETPVAVSVGSVTRFLYCNGCKSAITRSGPTTGRYPASRVAASASPSGVQIFVLTPWLSPQRCSWIRGVSTSGRGRPVEAGARDLRRVKY